MTGKTVAAIASLALTVGASSCLRFYDIGIETPIQAKLDVSSFQRVRNAIHQLAQSEGAAS